MFRSTKTSYGACVEHERMNVFDKTLPYTFLESKPVALHVIIHHKKNPFFQNQLEISDKNTRKWVNGFFI